MYLEYYGLERLPFSIAPDPESLYLSKEHQEALAHLKYSLTSHGGLVCLTGEVGTGKTTLCRAFIEEAPDSVDIAYIFNPNLSPIELIQSICDELAITYPDHASNKQMVDCLYHELLQRYAVGRKVICIIDEAQTMPWPLLEQVRLLTNLETSKEKLMTLILVGQPELQEVINSHGMRQFSQRITARCHLNRIPLREISDYLQCRLRLAGCDRSLFDASTAQVIWKQAEGIPRLINSIADRSLLGAFARGVEKPDKAIIENAAAEVLPSLKSNKARVFPALALSAALALLGLSFMFVDTNPMKGFWAQSVESKLLKANGYPASDCAELAMQSNMHCLVLDWKSRELKQLKRPLLLMNDPQRLVSTGADLPVNYSGLVTVVAPQTITENSVVEAGQSDYLIPWVREALDSLGITSGWNFIGPQKNIELQQSDVYDPLLAMDVEKFQRQFGLTADKIIGVKTLMVLKDQSGLEWD